MCRFLGSTLRFGVRGFQEPEPGGSMTNRMFVKTFRGSLRATLRYFEHTSGKSDELQPFKNLGLVRDFSGLAVYRLLTY